jgi:hypothetical protein
VALKGATEADKYRDDKFIMSVIDFKDIRSTAHLPYEMLVSATRSTLCMRGSALPSVSRIFP